MNQIINFSLSVLKQYRKICQKTTFYKYFFVTNHLLKKKIDTPPPFLFFCEKPPLAGSRALT